MSRDLSRSMWGVAGFVLRPEVGRWHVVCHSEEQSQTATWESLGREHVCRPKERFSRRDLKSLLRMTRWAYRPRTSSPTRFLTCGLPPSRLGIRNKFLLLSTCRRFISLCSIQNDRTQYVIPNAVRNLVVEDKAYRPYTSFPTVFLIRSLHFSRLGRVFCLSPINPYVLKRKSACEAFAARAFG